MVHGACGQDTARSSTSSAARPIAGKRSGGVTRGRMSSEARSLASERSGVRRIITSAAMVQRACERDAVSFSSATGAKGYAEIPLESASENTAECLGFQNRNSTMQKTVDFCIAKDYVKRGF